MSFIVSELKLVMILVCQKLNGTEPLKRKKKGITVALYQMTKFLTPLN